MISEQKAMNCARCKIRKLQYKYMGRIFDYSNCPYTCLENGIFKSPKKRGTKR